MKDQFLNLIIYNEIYNNFSVLIFYSKRKMEGSRISCFPRKIILKLFLITLASNAIGTMSLNILKPEDFVLSGTTHTYIYLVFKRANFYYII